MSSSRQPILLAIACAAALAACSHARGTAKPPEAGEKPPPSDGSKAIVVQDAIHGVRYELPKSDDAWEVSREGTAHSAAGLEAEVSSFPLAKAGTGLACRDHARARLKARHEGANPASDLPREEASSDEPATWSFTSGPAAAPVRNRWAFHARGSDCLVLHLSGAGGDPAAEKTFATASRSFTILPLPPERQREVDLLAGMGFLERRDPASALERFEALTQREPELAKAHFGALMAGFEIGAKAYGRALPHGEKALQAERDLSAEQRLLALRAVGVMELAEDRIHNALATLSELVVRNPELAEGQYNFACALARAGNPQAAIDHLRAAVKLDVDLAAHARDDDDFKTLRELPGFKELLIGPPAAQPPSADAN